METMALTCVLSMDARTIHLCAITENALVELITKSAWW